MTLLYGRVDPYFADLSSVWKEVGGSFYELSGYGHGETDSFEQGDGYGYPERTGRYAHDWRYGNTEALWGLAE